jgi:hypothetical protein
MNDARKFAALRVLLEQAYSALLPQRPRREAFRISLIRGDFPCPLFHKNWNSHKDLISSGSAQVHDLPYNPFFNLSASAFNHTCQFFNYPPSLINDTFRSLFYISPFISPSPSPFSSSFLLQTPKISQVQTKATT